MIASSRHASGNSAGTPEKSFEARLAAIETQMAGKTLEAHFREHAELTDRMLAYRFEEFEKTLDKKWDAKLAAGLAGLEKRIDGKLASLEERFDSKLTRLEESFDTKLETKFEPVRTDLKRLTDAVLALVARLP